MNRSVRKIVTGSLLLGGLVSAQDVKYNYDPTANFSKYHTYQWVSLPTVHPDQLIDKQIRGDIDAALAAKGLVQATSNPDIQVGYQIAVEKEQQWNAWGGRVAGWGQATSSTINIGTLGIDFFDPATKSLVWRGSGTKAIDPSGNPQKNMERLSKSIDKILKHFPPQIKKG